LIDYWVDVHPSISYIKKCNIESCGKKNVDKPNTSFVEDVQKHNEELHDICSSPNVIQSGQLKEVQKKSSP
jgi:hypothetical protein